jgi:hypothetical protein
MFNAAFMAQRIHCCVSAAAGTSTVIDYEKAVLCSPSGASVLVISAINPTTGVPTPAAYNLDGSAYAGAISALVACDTPDIESDPVAMCDNGTTSFLRWFVKRDGVIIGSADTTLAGALYTVAGPGLPSIGTCGVLVKPLIYTRNNASIVTMADILSESGATILHSVSVVQIAGTGSATGQTGGGFALLAGESHNWEATSLGLESLSLSALVLNAGPGGIQHITAVYSV